MKCGTRIALGLTGGYLLGRFRKTRWLLLLAAGVTSGRVADTVLQRGTASIGSSPELSKLAEQGREAAVAVLGSRMEGLTDAIRARTESLRQGLTGEKPAGSGAERSDPDAEAPPDDDEPDQDESDGDESDGDESDGDESDGDESEQPDRGSEEPAGQADDAGEEPGEPDNDRRAARQSRSPGSRQPESRRRAVAPRTGGGGRRTAARSRRAGASGQGRE
jgi:hypothetical protein